MTLKQITFYTFKILFAVFLIAIFSCKKNKIETNIPNVPVNYTVYLSLPQFSNLNSVGGYAIIPDRGYRGIIVYRRAYEEFVAFDLACPYNPTATGAILEVDSSGVTMVDRHCGSKFSLAYGSVSHGPATNSMKPYNADYSATNSTVLIYNY
jgi:hypothetical protein